MNEVEELMLIVGKSLGRSEQELKPFIDRVINECWFDTLDSLRMLDEKEWAELNLPPRYRIALQQKLLMVSTNLTNRPNDESGLVSNGTHISRVDANASSSSSIANARTDQTISPRSPARSATLEGGLINHLESLDYERVTLMKKIVANLRTRDPKFQKLNLGNESLKNAFTLFPDLYHIFELLGFGLHHHFLILQDTQPWDVTLSKTQAVLDILDRSAIQSTSHPTTISHDHLPNGNSSNDKPTHLSFDPYKATFSSAAGAMTVPMNAWEERQKELKALREQADIQESMAGPKVFKVIDLRKGKSLQSSPGSKQQHQHHQHHHQELANDAEDAEGDKQLLEEVFLKSFGKKETFASREKREILKSHKPADWCSLKFNFPDTKYSLVFEKYFSPATKISQVMELLLTEFINQDVPQWSLTCGRQHLNPNNTLLQENLIPSATLQLHLKDPRSFKGEYLKPHIAQLAQ